MHDYCCTCHVWVKLWKTVVWCKRLMIDLQEWCKRVMNQVIPVYPGFMAEMWAFWCFCVFKLYEISCSWDTCIELFVCQRCDAESFVANLGSVCYGEARVHSSRRYPQWKGSFLQFWLHLFCCWIVIYLFGRCYRSLMLFLSLCKSALNYKCETICVACNLPKIAMESGMSVYYLFVIFMY